MRFWTLLAALFIPALDCGGASGRLIPVQALRLSRGFDASRLAQAAPVFDLVDRSQSRRLTPLITSMLEAGDVATAHDPRHLSLIMQSGGTFLGSARSSEFHTEQGQDQAISRLDSRGISDLVVIGGGGSQAGALQLFRKGVPVIGLASTIDNDLYGAEPSLGVDTALNVALEAIDRLKATASSHRRAFIVQVMGRDCGYLALMTAIAGGAEAALIPEVDASPEQIARERWPRPIKGASLTASWWRPRAPVTTPSPWSAISRKIPRPPASSFEPPYWAMCSAGPAPPLSTGF